MIMLLHFYLKIFFVFLYRYCKSANEVFRKAESHYENGEEENAYILYMRYFFIYQKIRNSFEFNKDKVRNFYLSNSIYM